MFQYPGRKMKIAPWIVSHYPRQQCARLIDAFGGSGEMLCRSPRHSNEILNEINPNVVILYRQIQANAEDMIQRLLRIPYSRENFLHWKSTTPTAPFDIAMREFVVRSMSVNGIGVSFRSYVNRKHFDTSEYLTRIGRLRAYSARLQGVEITEFNSLNLLERYDDPETFFYLDPPYMLATRMTKLYADEMTSGEHIRLLRACLSSRAKILLSGYPHPIYDSLLANWNRTTRTVPNWAGMRNAASARGGKGDSRTEVLWRNYDA